MAGKQEAETLADVLGKLVAFPTVSGDFDAANACLDYMAAYLAERGMHLNRHESNGFPSLVATSRPTKNPKVLLQAHMDVVPCPPHLYKLTRAGDRLLGRGTFDMKFAGAVFLKVVDSLRSRLSDYDFGIMLTFDEEIGGKDGVGYLVEQGYRAGVCILPDGGQDWRLETSHKGAWIARLTAEGKSAHGSRPWDGDNAIHRLIDALNEIKALFAEQHLDSDSLSINKISGGEASNKVADRAEATIDLRFLSNEGCARWQDQVETIGKLHGIQIETIVCVQICEIDLEDQLVKSFVSLAEEIHGRPLGEQRSPGTSDAHYFADLGIPTILLRPEGGEPHGDNEWLGLEGLEKYYNLIKHYVETEAK